MRKLLLLAVLIVSVSSIGQNNFKLGSYTKIINKNIEFTYKNPLPPFQIELESYSSEGNINLVSAYYARTSANIVALQIYATIIPDQYKNLDWNGMINSEQQSQKFLNSFLGGANNKAMKISDFSWKTINGKNYLEFQSTLTALGVTQKQINWITVYKNIYVNIVGATLFNSFDENLSFFNEFSNSVILN